MSALSAAVMPSGSARSRRWQAFASALGLEAALLGVFMAWLLTHPPKPVESVVPLSIESAPEPVPQKQPVPEQPKPPPPQLPAPRPLARVLPEPLPQVTAPVPAALVPIQEPMAAPAAAPAHPPAALTAPAPPPPAPSVAAVDPAPAYNARLSAAVQAAFEVPAAAAALNFKGRTRVEFNLRDGLVSAIRVVQSSGLGLADRAATKAVQMAVYPLPPPALQGKEGSYQIWVECR